MRRPHWLVAFSLAAAGALSCGDSTGPAACDAELTSVEATVTVGASVVFNWSPACPVALVLVEDDASDMWLISGDGDTPAANVITPPVTYGQAPPAGGDSYGPDPLASGTDYELILWRILPSGSTATCLQKFGDACLLTIKVFSR